MYFFIRDFGQHSMEFVDALNDDMSRRFVLRPFHNSYVRDVAEGDGKLFCLADYRYDHEQQTHSTQLAVFNVAAGEEGQRLVLPFQAYTVTYLAKNNLLAVQFMDRDISFLKADTLGVIWRTEPLVAPELRKQWWFGWRAVAREYREISPDTRPYPPGCAYVRGRLFEDADGQIWGIGSSHSGDRKNHEILGTSAGFFSFDVAAQKQFYHPNEFSAWGAPALMAPSPNGRIAVRPAPQSELGAAYDAGHDPSIYVWMIGHQSLDLWTVSDQKPITRLHVSDTPVSKYVGQDSRETENHLRRLAAWTQKTRDRYRMPTSKPPGVENLGDGFDALRDLRVLLGKKLEVHWEENSEAVWVATRYSLRRITVDGRRGPLLIFDRFLNDEHRQILDKRPPGTDLGVGEVYPAVTMPLIKTLRTSKTKVEVNFYGNIISFPKSLAMSDAPSLLLTDDLISVTSIPDLTAKDIAPHIPGLIWVKSWEQDDVATGLQSLADILRRDIFSLTARGISLVFQVQSSFLGEKQFVQKLSEKDLDVVKEAKDVIDAWGAALRQHCLVFSGNDEGAGPLSYLLEYVAERNSECSQQLRDYCLLRDGEHESYSRDTVLRSYLDRMEFARPDVCRLAILHALLFGRDGRFVVDEGQQVSDWVHTGLLNKAREKLQPQDFAHFVLTELAEFEAQPDVFAAFGTHSEAAANAKENLLLQLKDSDWDDACRAILLGRDTSQ
ncbi:MAG: hypothetical protein ACKVKF_11830 [Rhodobacterales bacterium]